MKVNITDAIENKIDRSKWVKVKFSELVENIVEKITPKDSGLKHYIGLEHLDSGSLKIRRFGDTATLKGDKLKIFRGDLIFAKRNAYLKRIAIADFNAVASAHSMVLRPKSDNVLPRFLPFFLLSEEFWQRAIQISVGSLSPTINWKVLAKQEFLLPPKEEQVKLAELLWAIDEVIEKEISLKESLQTSYSTIVENLFSKKNEEWQYIKLSKLASINEQSLKSNTPADYTFKYLDIASIIEPKVVGELQTIKYSESPSRARRIVRDNSIVLSLVRPYHKSFVYIENGEGIIASTGTGVVNVKDEKTVRFIFHQFFSKRFILFCENRMTGTNYPAITPTDLKDFKIAIPKDKREIEAQTEKLEALEKNILKSQEKIDYSKNLQKSLINQIF